MILNDKLILEEMEKGTINIVPFDLKQLGSNSYDLRLSKHLATYNDDLLDCKKHNKITHFEIGEEGIILLPYQLYLGSTIEYTQTFNHIPFIDGKSSIGRLGINVHVTAGKGDIGFCGHWTLEITVTKPVRVYANMPIAQIYYHDTGKDTINLYNNKFDAKYSNQQGKPKESMMFKNSF